MVGQFKRSEWETQFSENLLAATSNRLIPPYSTALFRLNLLQWELASSGGSSQKLL
jgi:hypothetical protein